MAILVQVGEVEGCSWVASSVDEAREWIEGDVDAEIVHVWDTGDRDTHQTDIPRERQDELLVVFRKTSEGVESYRPDGSEGSE